MSDTEKEVLRFFNEGSEHLKNAHYSEAIECFTNVLKIDNKHISSYFNKGSCLSLIGKHDEAIECYDKAIELGENSVHVYIYKSECLYQLSRYEEAILCLKNALKIDNQNIVVLEKIGENLHKLNKFEESISFYKQVLDIDNNNINAYINISSNFYDLESYQKAIEYCQKIIEIEPKHQDANFNIGYYLYHLGKYKESVQYYKTVISIYPNDIDAHIELAKSLFLCEEHEEALSYCNKALQIDSNNIETYLVVGNICFSWGIYISSIKFYGIFLNRLINIDNGDYILEDNDFDLNKCKKYYNDLPIDEILESLEQIEYKPYIAECYEQINKCLDKMEYKQYITKCYEKINNNELKSIYGIYEKIEKYTLEYDDINTISIIKLKFRIFSDRNLATKVLGRESNRDKPETIKYINKRRVDILLESMPYLSLSSGCYTIWGKFIADCTKDDIFKSILYEVFVKKYIPKILDINVDEKLKKSYIYNLKPDELNTLNINNAILILEEFITGSVGTIKSIDDAINLLEYILLEGTSKQRIIGRYYLSIICISRNMFQEANNHAVTMFLESKSMNIDNKKLCSYLALIAWASSGYKIGNKTESFICILTAFDLVSEVEEYEPFLGECIKILSLFLYENNHMNDDRLKEFFEWNTYNKTSHISYLAHNNPKEAIKELEKSIDENKNKDSIWVIDMCNIINLYLKEDIKKSIELIETYFYDDEVNLLNYKKDTKPKTLKAFAQCLFVYMLASKQIDDERISKILNFLDLSIKTLEDRRSNLYHKEERGNVSKELLDTYRHYILTCCLILEELDSSEKELGETINNKILDIIPRMTLRTLSEQKQYNIDKNITDEAISAEKEYYDLISQHGSLLKKDIKDEEEISRLVKKINKLDSYLKKHHPKYTPLKDSDVFDLNKIKSLLSDDEVFYQFIITGQYTVSVVITKDSLDFKIHRHSKKLEIEKFINYINSYDTYDANEKDYITMLTNNIGFHLFDFLNKNKNIEKLYILSDYEVKFFNLAFDVYKNKLMDKVKSIINIIDYNVLSNKHITDVLPILNVVYGKKDESSIKMINNFISSNEDDNFLYFENESVDKLIKYIKDKNIKTLIVYAHGVHYRIEDGATSLDGRYSLIDIEKLLDNVKSDINLFILISCSGGTHSGLNPDNSESIWSSIFSNYTGQMILCKWDVNTQKTLEILKIIKGHIYNEIPTYKALLLAQNEVKNKYNDPRLFAGLEFWIN